MKWTIIVVCGQTATGKSNLAIELAHKHNGIIISCDSRQIYKGLDKGSNKLCLSERDGIVHYGFDIATIGETYDVSQFQKYAREIMLNEINKGRTVILCGGTGLYIDAVMFEHYTFGGKQETKPFEEWVTWSKIMDCSIEWVGLKSEREKLYERIEKRASENFFEIFAEVERLRIFYDPEWIEGLGLEYRYMSMLIRGEIDKETYFREVKFKTYQYARRQMTWFKRNKFIEWRNVE